MAGVEFHAIPLVGDVACCSGVMPSVLAQWSAATGVECVVLNPPYEQGLLSVLYTAIFIGRVVLGALADMWVERNSLCRHGCICSVLSGCWVGNLAQPLLCQHAFVFGSACPLVCCLL